MMRTINFKLSPDERLNSSLSQYRNMVQYALNQAMTYQIRSYFKLHSMLYNELRNRFLAPSRLVQDAMRQASWIYKRWKKEKNTKKPIVKRKSMILTPNQSLTFTWDKASILTFNGRVNIKLAYIKEYHDKYKEWNLKEARLVEKDGLWLKCIFEKYVPKAEIKDIVGIDLNFKNIAIASNIGMEKIKTDALQIALNHKKVIEGIQKKYGKASHQKLIYTIKRHGKRMKNRVIDRLRKIAKTIVKPNTAIVLEDLRKIRANKKGFAKLHLWCYRKLQNAIANKAEENGLPIIYVNPEGTSSICPRCNSKMKKLSYRKLWCYDCDYEMDRDELASINIRMRGIQLALIAPERDEDPNSVMGKLNYA